MTTNLMEHSVALRGDGGFSKRERKKVKQLLRRLRWLQTQADEHGPRCFSEAEAAALLWVLTAIGAICGDLIELRTDAADRLCVRPPEHGGDCDWRLGWGR